MIKTHTASEQSDASFSSFSNCKIIYDMHKSLSEQFNAMSI